MKSVNQFYSKYSEDSRLVERRSRQIEFITTMTYLRKYLSQSMVVADIGAGTGIYSIELSKICKAIYALDITKDNIELLNEKMKLVNINNIETRIGTGTDLSFIKDSSCDAVLCFGPFYHLQQKTERAKCIRECNRILKKNGLLFLSYINLYTAIRYFDKNGKYIDSKIIDKLENELYESIDNFDEFVEVGYFCNPESVNNEVCDNGFRTLHNIGVDGISYFIDEQINAMNSEQWKTYQETHLRHCEDKNSFGMSMHGLLISMKQ